MIRHQNKDNILTYVTYTGYGELFHSSAVKSMQ